MTESGFRSRLWAKVTCRFARVLSLAIAWGKSASRAFARPIVLVALLVVLVPLCVLLIHSAPHASGPIIVNTTSDETTSADGFCSLREAINNANAASDTTNGDCAAGTGTDTINFSVSGTITLGGTLPVVANTLTIDGSGQTITIDGAGAYGVLFVDSGATLSLANLTVSDGGSSSLSNGGGVYNNGTLNVTNSTFSGNSANQSGGIFNNVGGTATVTNSTFSGNSATGDGGGILSGGALTVSNCTFSGNSAQNGGGIFNNFGATLTITNSTFSGNSANQDGGGIYNAGGTLTVTNSTFSGNSAGIGGGGIRNTSGSITLTNSILSGSSGGNCVFLGGTLANGGSNISDDASCSFGTSTGANGQTIGDNVNPLLAASGLQNNGGPTQTIALQSNSPAIDAIPLANCPAKDQRGAPRPDPANTPETACDIGAYESWHIIVNTLSDETTSGDGFCSLREAINNANSPGTDSTGGDCGVGTGTDTINFSVTGTITLVRGTLPSIVNNLTIDGSGQTITVDGANLSGVLVVNSGATTLNLNNLTIANGLDISSFGGGGIDNEAGTLTVTNCTFSGNSAPNGGGIINGGTLTVTNSTFFSNSASGAGGSIYNSGSSLIAGTLKVANSTFSGNSAGTQGGGIFNGSDGRVTVTDSTFSGNSAVFSGGGIFNNSGGTVTVTNSTFSGNSAGIGGGGIFNNSGSATFTNSILANSSSGGQCGGGSSTAATISPTILRVVSQAPA